MRPPNGSPQLTLEVTRQGFHHYSKQSIALVHNIDDLGTFIAANTAPGRTAQDTGGALLLIIDADNFVHALSFESVTGQTPVLRRMELEGVASDAIRLQRALYTPPYEDYGQTTGSEWYHYADSCLYVMEGIHSAQHLLHFLNLPVAPAPGNDNGGTPLPNTGEQLGHYPGEYFLLSCQPHPQGPLELYQLATDDDSATWHLLPVRFTEQDPAMPDDYTFTDRLAPLEPFDTSGSTRHRLAD